LISGVRCIAKRISIQLLIRSHNFRDENFYEVMRGKQLMNSYVQAWPLTSVCNLSGDLLGLINKAVLTK
jgi:hypothetical protein